MPRVIGAGGLGRENGCQCLLFLVVKVLGRVRLCQPGLHCEAKLNAAQGIAGWPHGISSSRQFPRDPFLVIFLGWGGGEETSIFAVSIWRWANRVNAKSLISVEKILEATKQGHGDWM